MARIIPVIDMLGGQVVRAVGGRRSEYQPLVSRLTDSTDPATVARKLLDVTGATELYLADLDAIASTGRNMLPPIAAAEVWLDRGVQTFADLDGRAVGTNWVSVVGSETVQQPESLARSMFVQGRRGIVSVDLKEGDLLGNWRPGTEVSERAYGFIALFADAGLCRAVVLLDLTEVGERRGPSATILYLLDRLRCEWPDIEFVAGGGIRDRNDVTRLAGAGADAVLVASALHDGALP